MQPYERFQAWEESHKLALRVFQATDQWPVRERFGLSSQARRAAFSVAANIAEGSAKRGPREFRRYLDISLGSLCELAYTLRFARDLGLLSQGDWTEIDAVRDRAGKLLWGLYQAVKNRNT